MCKDWLCFVASLLLAPALTAPAGASVERRQIIHTVLPNGTVREELRQVIRLDSEAERERWTRHYIYLDENRHLESAHAEALRPDGKRIKVGRRDRDTLEVSGAGMLHSSQRFEELSFPSLPLGSVLSVEEVVEVEPYFPAGAIALTAGEAVGELAVEVRGTGVRWRLDGETAGLTAQPLPGGGVSVRGYHQPRADPPEFSPAWLSRGPVLRYSWAGSDGWDEVGRWYAGLLRELPPPPDTIGSLARELTRDLPDPAERLAALTDFVQQKIRYVAVEMGIGGYRPSPPGETLSRRWGDCKDKSLLLIQLLEQVDIGAWPVLIRAASEDRIDREFPAPNQFNHVIVAVDGAAVGAAGEYLFVDPTQTRGGTTWLNPWVQGQYALVVRDDGGKLTEIPLSPGEESQVFDVELALGATGEVRGKLTVEFRGMSAQDLLGLVSSEAAVRVEERARRLLGRLLPGAGFEALSIVPREGPAPEVTLSARVSLDDGWIPAQGMQRSFILPAWRMAPEPRHLTGRKEPMVLDPGRIEAHWKIDLAGSGCKVEVRTTEVANNVGSFNESIRTEGEILRVIRTTELHERWVEPGEVAAVAELALAEFRAARRRIRLACGGDP